MMPSVGITSTETVANGSAPGSGADGNVKSICIAAIRMKIINESTFDHLPIFSKKPSRAPRLPAGRTQGGAHKQKSVVESFTAGQMPTHTEGCAAARHGRGCRASELGRWSGAPEKTTMRAEMR